MIKLFAFGNEYELKYNLLPQKIHENDVIFLEIYPVVNGKISLETISDLTIESIDSSIIDIVSLDETHEYKTLVNLKANAEGNTFLYVFVKDFPTLEIPMTVYGNNLPKHLSLDIFPTLFDINENNHGILSLQLTDETGIPIVANHDYLIKLDTSKSGIVHMDNSNLIISKGESGTKQLFTVVDTGIVTIVAKTDDFESSETLIVEESSDRSIEISIIPDVISSSNTANSHLIAQLFEENKLIKASEDVTVFYEITSSNSSGSVNTSLDIDSINPSGYFQIKKGQTYGDTLFSIQKGNVDSYSITATSQNPLVITDDVFEAIDVELYGDEEIKFESLPVLSDGHRQLVGVIYLQDANGHPVTADRDVVVSFTTNPSVSIENSIIKNGFESSLVFGNMGNFVPDDVDIVPNIPNSEIVSLDIHGFTEDDISLETHVFTDNFLKDGKYWIMLYMESVDGLFQIPNPDQIKLPDSDLFLIDEDEIEFYPYFMLVPIIAIDSGHEDLTFSIENFETSISLSSISSTPDSLGLDYSDVLFKGIKDTFAIQILDSQGLPVKLSEDTSVKIFSSNPSIITFPQNVVIPQKSSFVSLDVVPESSGIVEISLISDSLPILTEEIVIDDTTPTIQITSVDIIESGESFLVSILAKQNGLPLQNVPIVWEFDGGVSTLTDEKTGPTGEAIASIIPTSDNSVKILASLNGGPLQSAFASKIVTVNASAIEIFNSTATTDSFTKPDMGGFDPVLIIIPLLIVGFVFYMRKKSK